MRARALACIESCRRQSMRKPADPSGLCLAQAVRMPGAEGCMVRAGGPAHQLLQKCVYARARTGVLRTNALNGRPGSSAALALAPAAAAAAWLHGNRPQQRVGTRGGTLKVCSWVHVRHPPINLCAQCPTPLAQAWMMTTDTAMPSPAGSCACEPLPLGGLAAPDALHDSLPPHAPGDAHHAEAIEHLRASNKARLVLISDTPAEPCVPTAFN